MPALAFGLKSAKSQPGLLRPPQKRKAVFSNDPGEDDDDEQDDAFSNLKKPVSKAPRPQPRLDVDSEPPHKSSKVAETTNLSALRSAKLHNAAASQVDASVYDYDEVYDTFHAAASKPKSSNDETSGPKYMTSLMQSAEVRKRDQLRAKEKLLQKEREQEGDEFADKEAFVTGAYKKQQEEMRQMEEDEKKKEELEEERRKKGGGMLEFNRTLLKKEEERAKAMEKALEEVKLRKESRISASDEQTEDDDTNEAKQAARLIEKGANIIVNDDGEVVDKRQLLGAGLNIAPKKKADSAAQNKKLNSEQPKEWQRSVKAQDARLSQRERQSRMMERQIEEMAEKQRLTEEAEKKAIEDKTKSKVTEADKSSAKERFLQRKREREEEAKKAKAERG